MIREKNMLEVVGTNCRYGKQ